MPPITALLHTANHALQLGRALEMLLPCSEILIVDHGSTDRTRRIACEYGARVVDGDGEDAAHLVRLARHGWVFCIEPGESINESLQASLYEWSARGDGAGGSAGSVRVREQNRGEDWVELPVPQTRLVPRSWTNWNGRLPAAASSAVVLKGSLLRFGLP